MLLLFMKKLLLAALVLASALAARATIYDVGPGFAKTRLRDVVWDQLQPGDVVNIHPTPGDYHEIILLSQSGTAAQRIVVRGIPDAQGKLPVIDGAGAIMDPNIHLYYNSIKGLGVILVSLNNHTAYGISPSYIDIESLEVRNGHTPYTYTDGAVTNSFSAFVAGIYIEHSHHMAIRGCDLHHNGLGIFANSKYGGLGTSTQDILVEHNWLHENGNIGSFREHGSYIESVGATYQYNVVGPQLPGANATGIKDRSSGAVVRYNTFINVGGNYMMMFVDPAYPLQYSRPDYRETFVYGNTFYNTANGASSLILYGGDQPVYSHYRQGTLHFYDNTVVMIGDAQPFRSLNVFDLPLKVITGGAPTNEKLDLRNNVFASLPLTPGSAPLKAYLMNTDVVGTLNLGTNWVSPGTQLSTSTPANITGATNLIYGDAVGANQPGFLNSSMLDFRLAASARSVDAAGPLAPAVTANTLGLDLTPYEEIGPVLASHPRAVLGAAADLGAFESDGSVATPGAGSLGFAYSTYGQVYYESSGTITFTVSRLGGSVGAVDINYTTVDESATGGLDFTAASGTLHWAAGDATPKTFTVTILPDALTEAQETFAVLLSNPTNGALLGPSSSIDTAIRDGSGSTGGTATGGALLFTATSYTASEGAGGALITVNRTGATAGAVTVHYATSNGTASAADYTATSGTLSWAAGDSTPQTFTVPLIDDALAEVNETIVLALSAPTGGAALGNPAVATLVINDNDHTPPPPRELIYAVGATTGSLIAFYSDAPQTPLIAVPITGIPAGESVRGIDFDPFTGKLYALVMNVGLPVTANHLYVVDPITGAATLVNPTSFSPLLVHPSCDLAFNPVTGDLHIAVGTGQQNLRLDVVTGNTLATDTPLAYAAGDAHSGATPSIVGADFQRLGGAPATYYGIDQTLDTLVRIGSVGGSPLAPASGQLTTVGPLGVDTSGVTGLDFSPTTGGAFACMGGPGATTGDLYYLDTATGIATLIGQIALSEAVRDIAIAPPYLAWRHAQFAGNIVTPGIAGDTATPAGDGVPNLLKYALGMNPFAASPLGLPVADTAGGHLSLGFTRYATDVEYLVEVSDDLATWIPGSMYGVDGTVLNTTVTTDVTAPASPAGWTQVQTNAALGTKPTQFMRLTVQRP
jgi:Domain of unknown function (DUF4394)/Calx-beta domain